ncbi:MAG: TIGR02646 family protein [Bryobacteraceae bacterium]|nr:TIGR02646 family protein [Bryobacteraceae bacterium]
MVRTPRCEAPAACLEDQERWTRRWQAILRGGDCRDWATKNAKKVLRQALRKLAHGKCVYCESQLEKDTPVEIEHYHPKRIHPERAFDWTNLFPACRLCNQSKVDVDHKGLLLKPDEEDPELFLWFNRTNGQLEPHPTLDFDRERRERALKSIEICGLQRGGLCEARLERMAHVKILLRDLSEQVRELLLRPELEYKFVIRSLLEEFGHAELAAEDRRRFEAPGGL